MDLEEEITQTDAWTVIDAYFAEKGLVQQQIDSFNEFVDRSLQEILDDSGTFSIEAPQQFGLGQVSRESSHRRRTACVPLPSSGHDPDSLNTTPYPPSIPYSPLRYHHHHVDEMKSGARTLPSDETALRFLSPFPSLNKRA